MPNTPVLIAGAGPTGLALALGLARRGVPFRLVDDGAGPGAHSRAMVVHARTLEFYQQFGFADAMVAQGVETGAAHLREDGREVLSVSFAEIGGGLSPYPFVLAYPQDDHERFLVDRLAEAGGAVEWNTTLAGFAQDAGGVRATLAHADGRAEEVRAAYVCGCDGAHSRVRQTLGLGFPGGTYDQRFFVADVEIASGFDRDLYINLGAHVLVLMFPVRSSGMQRLIGLVPPELADEADLTFAHVRPHVEPPLGVRVTAVNWFSSYRVHHRVAEHFRADRAFLLGDAGHIHSPVGGQGMNTGIGDAVNLGWKLADVVRGRAGAALLDSYEAERIGFARTLVATTDRAFTPMVAGGWRGELVRRVLAPAVMAVGTRFAAGRHELFRTMSQTRIHYDHSPLSAGRAGHVDGGDRLPWTGARGADNFAPLRSLDWQAHVYGVAQDALVEVCGRLGLAVHAFPWSDAAEEAGLARDAVYLVRPDGHVALAAAAQDPGLLEDYVGRWGLRFAEA